MAAAGTSPVIFACEILRSLSLTLHHEARTMFDEALEVCFLCDLITQRDFSSCLGPLYQDGSSDLTSQVEPRSKVGNGKDGSQSR